MTCTCVRTYQGQERDDIQLLDGYMRRKGDAGTECEGQVSICLKLGLRIKMIQFSLVV